MQIEINGHDVSSLYLQLMEGKITNKQFEDQVMDQTGVRPTKS